MIADCTDCVYAIPAISDDPDEGPLTFCHRYPPTVLILDGVPTQVHPAAGDGCGEKVTS